MSNKIVPIVRNCARCGGDHSDVEFFEFLQPVRIRIDDLQQTLTHWAMCPRLTQPMLAIITEKAGVNIEHYHKHEEVSDGESQEGDSEAEVCDECGGSAEEGVCTEGQEEGTVSEEPSEEAGEERQDPEANA